MPTFTEGYGYHRGVLRNPAGDVVLSFPVDVQAGINVELHNVFFDLDPLLGKFIDVSALPASLTIDGTQYDITYEEDSRQELIDAVQGLADELGITTVKAKAVMRHIYKVIKAARHWG
jgi:hypothetical protein